MAEEPVKRINHGRALLNVKDIMKILRCSRSTAQRQCVLMRIEYKIRKRKPIPIEDFCDYTRLRQEKVEAMLYDAQVERNEKKSTFNLAVFNIKNKLFKDRELKNKISSEENIVNETRNQKDRSEKI